MKVIITARSYNSADGQKFMRGDAVELSEEEGIAAINGNVAVVYGDKPVMSPPAPPPEPESEPKRGRRSVSEE